MCVAVLFQIRAGHYRHAVCGVGGRFIIGIGRRDHAQFGQIPADHSALQEFSNKFLDARNFVEMRFFDLHKHLARAGIAAVGNRRDRRANAVHCDAVHL